MSIWSFVTRSLAAKVIAVAIFVALGVAIINGTTFVSGYREAAMETLEEKAAAFTAVADEAKNHAAKLTKSGAYDTEKLLAELEEIRADGGSYIEAGIFDSIPVIVGLEAAKAAGEREGIDFRVPALEPRNPSNDPMRDEVSGTFRREMLLELKQRVASGDESQISRVNSATNELHVMRPIVLGESCMMCHGQPGHPVGDPDGDGIDRLGFPMEQWAVGDMHGAYEVVMPLAPVNTAVAGFLGRGAAVTVPLLIAAGVGLVWLMRRLVTKPLARITDELTQVAMGDGDLSRRLPTDRKDELGSVSDAFNTLLEKFQKIIAAMIETTQDVSGKASAVAEESRSSAETLRSRERTAEEIAGAAEELARSAEEVSTRSETAKSAAADAGKVAQEGGETVERLIVEVSQISETIGVAAKEMTSLAERSNEIGTVVSVINEIAEQTNLLALNAAIEAARAGEHGRGFAVVADEVRKLADRTTGATEQIEELIRAIQADTERAESQIDRGKEAVTSGEQRAGEASDGLRSIMTAATTVDGEVDQIVISSREQTTTSQEVSGSILQITETLREAAAAGAGLAERIAELERDATELGGLAERFNLRIGRTETD
ncbi:MAG: methyl-accepting chemotaxis protein [Planctomycetota bacterium]